MVWIQASCPPVKICGLILAVQNRFASFDPHIEELVVTEDSGGKVRKHLDQSGVSNGIVWTADSRTMCYVDSMQPVIDAFDFVLATGDIFSRRPFVQFPRNSRPPME